MNKFAYAAAGALLVLLIVLPFLSRNKSMQLTRDSQKLALNYSEGITQVKDHAFGAITGVNAPSAAQGLGGGGGFARTQSGGGGSSTGSEQAEMAAPVAEMDESAKMGILPRPDIINYNYVYSGDEIVIDKDQMAVYKRIKSQAGGQALAQAIAGMNFDQLDISKFKDTQLTNLSLNEDREYGYSLYLNLSENTFDINQNWQKWPHPEQACRDEACYSRYRLTINDVPTDDKILSIANSFVKDYGIDISNYGEPFVQDNWRRMYDQVEDKAFAWIPEDMSVFYPIIIEGQMVYDQGGNPTGLYVSVNIKHNRVSSLNSLRPHTFESSNYEIINDSAKIKELAEQGGIWPMYLYEGSDKTQEVKLGTPQMGLMQYWKYDQETGQSEELYIPALIFPITNFSELGPNFYQQQIVLPLVKDILEEMRPPIGIPEPMPLIKEEVQSVEVDSEEVPVDLAPDGEVKGESESATIEPMEISTQINLEY